jgi:lipoyl(octanoyl) transferase
MKTQHVVQGVVYRWQGTELEFLVVKRVPEDGGFWQAITGTVEEGETMVRALRREVAEEAGISDVLHVSECLETYVWRNDAKGIEGQDKVFAVEVASDEQVVLDGKEHTEFKWLALGDATTLLKYDGNKRSMERVARYAQERQRQS